MEHIACDIKIESLKKVISDLVDCLNGLSNPEPYGICIAEGRERELLIEAWQRAEKALEQ